MHAPPVLDPSTPPTGSGLESEEPPLLGSGRRRAVLAAMCLALVLVVAGVSMLNNALPGIAAGLGASQTDLQWIVDAYAVTLAALLLPLGALGDRLGQRKLLLVGIAVFGVAAALASTASSTGALIGWRALAGVGAAMIMPATLSTITAVFPPSERTRAVGVWAGFAGAGGILGMLASGALLEAFDWSSIFVATAVLAAVAFVAAAVAAPDTADPEHSAVDLVGAVLSVVGIGALVVGIIEGPHRGWTDALTLSGIGVGILSLAAFVAWSLRQAHPLLDPRLFRLRGFAAGSLSLLVQFLAMFGFFFVALQHLQLVLGYGTLKASVALVPVAAVILPLSTAAATLAQRFGMRRMVVAGLSTIAAGFLVLATLQVQSGYPHFLAGLLLVGTGLALSMTPATDAIVASLPAAQQGVASAVNDTARELGAALGVAILGSAFTSGYRGAIDDRLAGAPAELAEVAREAPAAAIAVASRLGEAARPLADAARESFVVGMHWSLGVGAAMLLAGAAFVWFRAPDGGTSTGEPVDPAAGAAADGI